MKESSEVLKNAIDKVGVKFVAAELKMSNPSVYKWVEDKDTSGSKNPLDRLMKIIQVTEDKSILDWLCQKFDGCFVPDLNPKEELKLEEYMAYYQDVLRNFYDLSGIMLESIIDDQKIDKEEYESIKEKWYKLKQYLEGFVNSCEKWSDNFKEE